MEASAAQQAGAIAGVRFSDRVGIELKGVGRREYVLARTEADEEGVTTQIARAAAGTGETVLTELPGSAPVAFMKRALVAAWSQIPQSLRVPGAFRWSVAWPAEQRFDPVPLPMVKEAIESTSSTEASVFSFLRYHDYARWNTSRRSWGFSSEQRHDQQPRYVAWEVSRFGAVFQHSAQQQIAGNTLAAQSTTWYCARAVDMAGMFFEALGLDVAVTLLIAASGTQVRPISERIRDGDGGLYEPLDAYLWRTMRPGEWKQGRVDLATAFAQDLLLQAGATQQEIEVVRPNAEAELDAIDSARTPSAAEARDGGE